MTPQELIDLGRRAVACLPVEKWPTGSSFRCSHGENWIISSNTDDGCYVLSQHGDEYLYPGGDVTSLVVGAAALLDEPATLGALVFGLLPSLDVRLDLSSDGAHLCDGWHHGTAWVTSGRVMPTAKAAVLALESLS